MLLRRWGIADMETSIPRHAKHLLGFNEPNHLVQAKLTPQEAVVRLLAEGAVGVGN